MSLLTQIISRKVLALFAVASFSALLSSTVNAYGQSPEEIAARIAPIGNVCIAGEECEVASAAVATSDGPRSGEDVYGAFCTACHSIGVAGAPKFGNADDWAPRVAQGMDTLLSHALNGLNAMPARGTCSTCSDEEIESAVTYMVDNSQ
ncbi:cytochrome c5 family protein [Marinomonas sp. 15G1-11]|uniref:Cytochrome c5 family protein n=1 Tax=Marinomonas phaeophyticola TaxID=3004091 RepID=A0ABT4JSZ5_9GAMM|nr:cytochrome c5 family protein [Marinomonas sp. 15G1-11]MCZ2721477.1 cytochrome c5 family protein [Marinomonas sp. 15G1-11]